MDQLFDVVLSNHVLEHIAPLDLKSHVSSIFKVLDKKGIFIINMPNRLFGPHDVTRIIDFTYTNKTSAQGTHINEMTYIEVVQLLKLCGFKSFYTYLPLVPIKSLYDKFPKIKIPVTFFVFIEKSPLIMKLLHKLKYKSRCIAKFDILLVARK